MNKQIKGVLGWASLIGAMFAAFIIWITIEQERVGKRPAPAVAEETVTPTMPEEEIVIAFVDELPTAVSITHTERAPLSPTCTATPTATPTATVTPTPTEMPKKSTPTPKPTKTPTPTVKPSKTAKYERGTTGTRYAEVNGTHGWKPWARHTAVTNKQSPQYRLEQVAKTDELGRRIAKDPNGEWRYLVALPVYWAGGTFEDIGRCVDIKMANGTTLKCVLADIKKIEHSLNGEGKYGANGEIIEVICDKSKLVSEVLKSGDASRFGAEWQGDVESITALDIFIKF